MNGRPLATDWVAAHVPAVVETFFGGQAQGTAIAEVLFGAVNPAGRMPMSVSLCLSVT